MLQEEPFHFSLTPAANFGVKPSEGKLGPHESMELLFSFRPHQLGQLRGVMQLLGFGGKVSALPVRMAGTCTQPNTRVPLGGIDKLPEDFELPPKPVVKPKPGESVEAATWQRNQMWNVSQSYEETSLSVLQV